MNLRELFEYQKFSPNSSLQAKIDKVTEKYLSGGIELDDEVLDVSAAGEPYQNLVEKPDGSKL